MAFTALNLIVGTLKGSTAVVAKQRNKFAPCLPSVPFAPAFNTAEMAFTALNPMLCLVKRFAAVVTRHLDATPGMVVLALPMLRLPFVHAASATKVTFAFLKATWLPIQRLATIITRYLWFEAYTMRSFVMDLDTLLGFEGSIA